MLRDLVVLALGRCLGNWKLERIEYAGAEGFNFSGIPRHSERLEPIVTGADNSLPARVLEED